MSECGNVWPDGRARFVSSIEEGAAMSVSCCCCCCLPPPPREILKPATSPKVTALALRLAATELALGVVVAADSCQ